MWPWGKKAEGIAGERMMGLSGGKGIDLQLPDFRGFDQGAPFYQESRTDQAEDHLQLSPVGRFLCSAAASFPRSFTCKKLKAGSKKPAGNPDWR